MKKLTKNGLAQMAALLPELDEEDQRIILGGTASAPFPADYTGAIPDPIPSVAGTPTATTPSGPYAVTGCYTTSTPIVTTVETSYAVSGCVPTATTSMATSTTTGCYTFEEMNQMMGNGTWNGGYIDEIGYVGEIRTFTGCAMPDSDETIGTFCSNLYNSVTSCLEDTIDSTVHGATSLAASFGNGFYGMYLDFKYNGLDAGNGKGKIQLEEYLASKDEYHAYHYSYEKGFWREGERLPDSPDYKDFCELAGLVAGGVNISIVGIGGVGNFIIEQGSGLIIGSLSQEFFEKLGE